MSNQINRVRVIHKHDTEANWNTLENFIPYQGEIIVYDKDENHSSARFKIGDGENNINNLPFYSILDTTLSEVGAAAEASSVGTALDNLESNLNNLESNLNGLNSNLNNLNSIKNLNFYSTSIPAGIRTRPGWYRLAEIQSGGEEKTYPCGLLFLSGTYTNGKPSHSIIALSGGFQDPSLVQLSGTVGRAITKIRLINKEDKNTSYYLEAYQARDFEGGEDGSIYSFRLLGNFNVQITNSTDQFLENEDSLEGRYYKEITLKNIKGEEEILNAAKNYSLENLNAAKNYSLETAKEALNASKIYTEAKIDELAEINSLKRIISGQKISFNPKKIESLELIEVDLEPARVNPSTDNPSISSPQNFVKRNIAKLTHAYEIPLNLPSDPYVCQKYVDFTFSEELPAGTYTVCGAVNSTDTQSKICLFGLYAPDPNSEQDRIYAQFKRTGDIEMHQIKVDHPVKGFRLNSSNEIARAFTDVSIWRDLHLYYNNDLEVNLGEEYYCGTLNLKNNTYINNLKFLELSTGKNYEYSTAGEGRILLNVLGKPNSKVWCSHAYFSGVDSKTAGTAYINQNGALALNCGTQVGSIDDFEQFLTSEKNKATPIQIIFEPQVKTITSTSSLTPVKIYSNSENKQLLFGEKEIKASCSLKTFEEQIISPITTAWEKQLVERISQCLIPKTALQKMAKASSGYHKKGTTLTGINYSATQNNKTYPAGSDREGRHLPGLVGLQVPLSTYYSALENPASVMYTEDNFQENAGLSTYYGINCSGFVSFVCGFDKWKPTDEMKKTWHDQIIPIENEYDLFQIQRGDILLNTMVSSGAGDHTRIVKDVIYSSKTGQLLGFNIAESWKPFCLVEFYTPEEFLAQMFESQPYRLIRLKDEEKKIQPLEKIHYSKTIFPDRGDGGRYSKEYDTIKLYIPDVDNNDIIALAITLEDTSETQEIDLDDISKVEVTTIGEETFSVYEITLNDDDDDYDYKLGKYSIDGKKSDGTNTNDPCYIIIE